MTDAAQQPSDELTTLRARLAEVEQKNSDLAATNGNLAAKNTALQKRVEHLQRLLFGRKSERLAEDKHPKLPFVIDEPEPPAPPHVDEAPDEEYETVQRKKVKRGATRVSKDLPREVKRIELPEAERMCSCCNEVMLEIGEEVSERLDCAPAVMRVIETRRVKYACKKHEEAGVLTPPPPVHPIAKGMATAGLLAHVVVAKFKDHLPLYRQSNIFARHGAEIAESTLGDWVKDTAEMVSPVVAAMKESVLASHVVQTDDTSITVLDANHPSGSRRSFLWSYVGDRDEVVFDFTLGRGREGPRSFLGDYQGYLQADAYSGYDIVFQKGTVIEVGCWAHARRRFFDASEAGHEQATIALQILQRLYSIEREAKQLGLDFGKRRERRQQEAKPLLEGMKPWLVELKPTVLPKSPMGEAIGYALRQWDPLTRYLEDGRLEIDNNRVERQIRSVAVGRKNWMFAGSGTGAQRAATIYSLICTCSLLSIEPWVYLKDVLQRIAEGQDPTQLTPRLWKAALPTPATT